MPLPEEQTNLATGNLDPEFGVKTENRYQNVMDAVKNQIYKFGDRRFYHSFEMGEKMHAHLYVLPKDGNLKNVAADQRFVLQRVEENRTEKFQIFETFGDPVLFFFDEKTKVYNFSGFLLDGDFIEQQKYADRHVSSWANTFKTTWNEVFRGTVLARENKIAILAFNNNVMWGYPVNLSMSTVSESPHLVPFSFNMIITRHKVRYTDSSTIAAVAGLSEENTMLLEKNLYDLEQMEIELADLRQQYEDARTDPDKQNKINNKIKLLSDETLALEAATLGLLGLPY
ncbi:MAG: hypothetical protein ACW98F_00095 [Candidatus Hodarchaeales archaeon]|jgi:hypothetical protein